MTTARNKIWPRTAWNIGNIQDYPRMHSKVLYNLIYISLPLVQDDHLQLDQPACVGHLAGLRVLCWCLGCHRCLHRKITSGTHFTNMGAAWLPCLDTHADLSMEVVQILVWKWFCLEYLEHLMFQEGGAPRKASRFSILAQCPAIC